MRLSFGDAEKGEGQFKTLFRTPPARCDQAEKGAKDSSTLYLEAYEKDIDLKTKNPSKTLSCVEVLNTKAA